MDELVRRDRNDARQLDEMETKCREIEADNRVARYNVEKLRDEFVLVER